MDAAFYVTSAIAVIATVLVITSRNAVHALLYLIVSLLSVALLFFLLGAPFVAALEVIIYAGAIMVLFVFVVMLLNLGPRAGDQERQWQPRRMWVGPALLSLALAAELVFVLSGGGGPSPPGAGVAAKEVGAALFGPYLVGVELASMLLLVGLVGACYLGQRARRTEAGRP